MMSTQLYDVARRVHDDYLRNAAHERLVAEALAVRPRANHGLYVRIGASLTDRLCDVGKLIRAGSLRPILP